MICEIHGTKKKPYTNTVRRTNKNGELKVSQYIYEYCNDCQAENSRRNPNRLKNTKRHRDNIRFGGVREVVITRDGCKCLECGMTREQHYEKWGRDITVDHIDGNGRYSSTQNNNLENLQTLCLSCHSTKDAKRRVAA